MVAQIETIVHEESALPLTPREEDVAQQQIFAPTTLPPVLEDEPLKDEQLAVNVAPVDAPVDASFSPVDAPVSPPSEPGTLPRELRLPTHPLVTESEAKLENTLRHLDFYGTTYKSSFFAPPTPPLSNVPTLPFAPGGTYPAAATGFHRNFPLFRANVGLATASGGGAGRGGTPRPASTRRVRTAPAGDAGLRRLKLNQIKELTGYQVNFGPNNAAHLPVDYVSCHNSDFNRVAKDLGPETTTGEKHSPAALLFVDKPILARSWQYSPSGYFRNGIAPRFDSPDYNPGELSTTKTAFPACAAPRLCL